MERISKLLVGHDLRPTINRESQTEFVHEDGSFYTTPRYIRADLRSGRLNYREYEVYLWIRSSASICGIAVVNAQEILDNLRHLKSIDRVTKIIRSLKRKKYIYYQDRRGYRGSFEVHLDEWHTKNKVVLKLDRFYGENYVRGEDGGEGVSSTEVVSDVSDKNPRLDGELTLEEQGYIGGSALQNFRGGKNEIETEKENEVSNPNSKVTNLKKVATLGFVAKTSEEKRCKEIANEIGDITMNFVLSVMNRKDVDGMRILEIALIKFREMVSAYEGKGSRIKNAPALFNRCVKDVMQGV